MNVRPRVMLIVLASAMLMVGGGDRPKNASGRTADRANTSAYLESPPAYRLARGGGGGGEELTA